ncbi:gag-pol polyprotein [Cucumis melo var. makuwa]|uniref:Gag-pol polyprotein n=1 Tax=Cucumis melo var. makuwa TaxID=1194695 RepID=A0A5A7TPL4_CUCMM|nr:gag-pol polyprotein [Cucumis melo var. makuwa]
MDDHMTEDALEDAKKKKDWLCDDARLYLQIKNSIESEIIGLFFRVEQKAESITNYFMRLKKITVELALLLPFSSDVKVQQAQREKMAVMIFLNGLLTEFGMAKAVIPLLDDAFICVLRIENSPNGVSIPQSSSDLISKNNNLEHLERWMAMFRGRVMIIESQILQRLFVTIVASVTISADEYAKFQSYQDSLQATCSSAPVASTVALGNTMCLLTSSTKWVIDSGVTAYMIGNYRIFSRPLLLAPFPSITLVDGSTSSVLGSGTIHLTPSFSLSSDRVTKKIIDRGYESGGLYLFDHQVSQVVACPVIPSPFEVHCRLGHPSLFVLKKLYPEFRTQK